MKNIKNFIKNQVNESIDFDKIEYIITESMTSEPVVEVCYNLSDLESFIKEGWDDPYLEKLIKGAKDLKPKEFFYFDGSKSGFKSGFVIINRLK